MEEKVPEEGKDNGDDKEEKQGEEKDKDGEDNTEERKEDSEELAANEESQEQNTVDDQVCMRHAPAMTRLDLVILKGVQALLSGEIMKY